MFSLGSPAQPSPRARPAYAARARSSRSAFAHQAVHGAHGVILTGLSFGGTGFSCDSGARFAHARPVSASPTTIPGRPRPSHHHSACAPAALSLLLYARLVAAQRRRLHRQRHHHRQRGHHHLLRRRQLFFDVSMLLSAAAAAAAGRCQAAWSCKAACRAAQTAQQRSIYLRAAQAARPRASGGFGGAARLACSQLAACIMYVKKC